MATLSPKPSASPHRRGAAKKCERYCCRALTHFPLAFVYGLTSWAVWVEARLGFLGGKSGRWSGTTTSLLGIILYILANTSYTTAVFTDPGSPLKSRSSSSSGYSSLPTHELDQQQSVSYTSLTAKSTGRPRYCKKCQCVKPDRAHHCSTCGRCVLKMDHHCPWLATCVGLRNYKPFLLFLVYTTLFCWVCFAVTAEWVWAEIVDDTRMEENLQIVNTILLAVLSGIIGLVLTGFTGWHVYLLSSGQTTIESLEKTRYLSPVKKSMERQIQKGRQYLGHEEQGDEQSEPLMDQLKEIHANALPGVTRPEEGEERSPYPSGPGTPVGNGSPAHDSLRRNYTNLEQQRERERYEEYLDEQDSAKLPHAFDLGWRRNLAHVLGERKLFWPLPICNTTGDGWKWDVSEDWLSERDEVARQRTIRHQAAEENWRQGTNNGFAMHAPPSSGAGRYYTAPPLAAQATHRSQMNANGPPQAVPMRDLDRRKSGSGETDDEYDSSSDEDSRKSLATRGTGRGHPTSTWNDVPDEFLSTQRDGRRSRSTGRRKGD